MRAATALLELAELSLVKSSSDDLHAQRQAHLALAGLLPPSAVLHLERIGLERRDDPAAEHQCILVHTHGCFGDGCGGGSGWLKRSPVQ